jgi:short-subunit dehydrogenase
MIPRKGSNVLVIGGTRGIGLEMARALAKRGANVVVTGSSYTSSEKSIQILQKEFPHNQFWHYIAPLQDTKTTLSTIQQIMNSHMPTLVYFNAAVETFVSIEKFTEQGMIDMLTSNVVTTTAVVRLVITSWRKANQPGIFIGGSSMVNNVHMPFTAPYTPSRVFQSLMYDMISDDLYAAGKSPQIHVAVVDVPQVNTEHLKEIMHQAFQFLQQKKSLPNFIMYGLEFVTSLLTFTPTSFVEKTLDAAFQGETHIRIGIINMMEYPRLPSRYWMDMSDLPMNDGFTK